MRDLDRALADIVAIRAQLARDTVFHGYGPATLAVTGVLALMMAGAQTGWLDDPTNHPGAYFGLWFVTAITAVALVAVETVMRSRRLYSRLGDDLIHNAIRQFLPSGVTGLLLYLVLARYQPDLKVLGWQSGTLKAVWDNIRGLDLCIQSRRPRIIKDGAAWTPYSRSGQ